MSLSSLLPLSSLLVTLCLIALAWRQRRTERRRRPGGLRPANVFLTSYALGNALQVLQQLTQPSVRYVLAEQNDEEADEEGNGDPPTPETLYRRQLRHIRRGQPVDRLQVPLAAQRTHRR